MFRRYRRRRRRTWKLPETAEAARTGAPPTPPDDARRGPTKKDQFLGLSAPFRRCSEDFRQLQVAVNHGLVLDYALFRWSDQPLAAVVGRCADLEVAARLG